jgi:ribosomal protein S18 acetylase RimI-like enzyme
VPRSKITILLPSLICSSNRHLCSRSLQAFGSKDGARFRTVAQWEKQLTGAVAGKKLAREEARLDRYLAQNETIKGQLSTLQGYSSNPRSRKREEVEEKARQRLNYRRRSFYCCVAQDRTSSQIIGCVAVTLARPEAVLPPPFPTTARLRCYISNIAVSPAHRRQGVATAMINKCERIARLWGQTAVFLHVEIQNEAAGSLYRGLGYQQVPWIGTSSLPWKGKQRTILMMKELRPLPKRKNLYLNLDNNGSNSTETSGSTSSDSGVESSDGEGKSNAGVFVWNVKEVVEVEEEENATNCE